MSSYLFYQLFGMVRRVQIDKLPPPLHLLHPTYRCRREGYRYEIMAFVGYPGRHGEGLDEGEVVVVGAQRGVEDDTVGGMVRLDFR